MTYSSCRRRFKIRPSEGLRCAHEAICRQYDVPLDAIAQTVAGYRVPEPSVDLYRALLAETWLGDMFSSLSGSGWSVNRPFDQGYKDGDDRGGVTPTGIGRRLKVESGKGQPLAEFDDFVLLNGMYSAILEATSGVNSYDWRCVTRKMNRLYEVTGAKPGFVFGVPSDHCLLSNGWAKERNGFLWRGGMIIEFDANASDFLKEAESIYRDKVG